MATTITSDGGYTSSTPTDPIPEFKPSSFAEDKSFERDLLRPSIEAEKKYQEEGLKIRQDNYKTIKKHTQNFEEFEPTASDEVRNRALVAGYIDTQFGDNARPSNDHGILRDAIAKHKFDSVGMGSDEAFLEAMRNDYKREDEEQSFWDNLDRKATLSALMGGGQPHAEFHESVRGDPFAKANWLEIRDRWKKNREALEEKFGPSILFDIKTTFQEMGYEKHWLVLAWRRTKDYSDEEKDFFIGSLRDLATEYPSQAGDTFLGNFGASTRRGVMGALDKTAYAAEEFFRNSLGVGPHNVFVAPFAEQFGTEESKEWSLKKREENEKAVKDWRRGVDWSLELRSTREQDWAPITALAPKDSTLRAVEEGIYAMPGALTSSAVAFIPGVGLPLTFGMMKEFDREKYRREILSNGGSREDAYRISGAMSMVSAVPNALLEKFQSYGLAGKIPGMSKVFNKLDDIFANKIARGGTKMFVAGTAETAVELTQQANTDLVQDITNSFKEFNPIVPDIEWKNGKDGHFDGYFNKAITTFVAVAPLGVMVAGRGMSLESKAEAMKVASPLERKAFGITEEASAKLDAAQTPREMVEAFENAVKTREPWSETAQESVMELEAMHDMRAKTNEDSEKFGVSPAVRRTPDSPTFEVFDRATGETIVEVETSREATEEVFSQLQLKEEENAHYFQELQASFEAASLDVEQSGESVEVATGKFTDAEVELASPEAGRRLQTERELLEQRDGGTGEVAQEVMSDRNTQTIAGAYTPAGNMGRKEAVTQIYNGSSVLTLIHERGHAKRRKLMQSGAWTRADQISSLQGLDSLITEAKERFLPDNFAELSEGKQEVAMDEAVAELAEVLALNSRKGKNSKMGNLIKKGLSSMVQARVPGAAQLSSFIKTMGQFFGLQLRRATILKKAVRDGKLDQTQVDQLTDMLVGEDTQEVFEQERDAIPTQIVDGQQVDTPFSPGDSRMLAPTTPQEISEAKEPIVEQIYLKETEKFKEGVESGRIKTNTDIRNFIGQHMVMHQPDTAMAGEVRVDGESFVKGKGGVYYPVLFSEEGYFWASTAAKAEEMAGALNEIGERNGGKIYMALTSADVDKLFSSTTMSVGTMNFFKQLAKNPRKYGITEAQLNKMLIQASKTQIVSKLLIKGKDGKPVLNEKGEKTYKVKTQEFGHTLSKGSKLNDTMTELEGWLQPFSEDKSTGSSFDVRKSFVFDLMRQVSAHLKGKPAQSKAVAGLLTQESNEFAKNKVIKGDLSLAAFTQGLGDMLSEPLTKTFQKFGNKGKGYIYAVIEIEGKVKAIDTKGHESYPKAIVSAEGKLPTVHVMKDGYHWTDVVQEKDSGARVERVTKEMNKVYPTGGFSAYKGRPLQFGEVQENAEGVELSFSPGDARMLSDLSENVMRRVRAPESRAVVFEQLVDRIDALKRDVSKMIFGGAVEQEAIPDARSMKSLKKESAFRQADLREQYEKDGVEQPAKKARAEANEWLEGEIAKQKKHYNPVARIRRSLVMYDALLKTLPPELRGKMGGFVQIGKLNSDKARLEFLEQKVEQLDVEVDKWISGKHRKQIEKIFKANRPKKKSSGQSKVDSDATYADQVMKIEKLSKLTRDKVEKKILKIDGKLETETDEAEIQKLTEKRDNLSVFGDIDGMKANALGDFYQNLNAIHRQGKLLKAMTDEQFNQFLQETIGMVNEDVTGGQGEMTQSEAKAANEKRRERVIPTRYIGAEDVKIDGMADFQRQNLSWEWIMNNISRANKAVGTLASQTHKRLSTMVHVATHQESRVNMDTVEHYKEALARIFGVKVAGQTSLNMDLTKAIYGMEEVSPTKISKMEYGKEGRSTSKRIPASKVQAILNGEATLEGLGISESDWKAIQARYTEIKDSGKSIKPNTRVEYESQTEGEAKMMSLSQSQAINLTMLWRQEGLKDSMEHEGYSDQTMKEMEEFLTPESKEIRDWLTIQYEDNYHKINKVFRAQNGFSLPKTDFYSPAVRIAKKEAKDMSIDSEGRQAMSVDPNFTITRTTNRAPMDQTAGALDIYMSHALQTNHYVSWADTVKVLRSVFADQSVRNNISGYVGRSALSTIDEKLNWFADGGNRKAKHVAWLDKLRAAHTYGSLGFKWSIAVKQLTSLPAYAFDMSFKDFGKYFGLFLKDWKKNIKFMLDTPYVQNRLKSGYERDVIDGLRRDGGSKFMKALQVGMLSGKAGEIVPVIIGGWMARQRSYDNSKKAGMSEANALKQAEIDFEMITDRAQQAGNLKDLSSFKGGGSMFKLFSMYKTSPLQYYANVSETFFDAGGIKGLLTKGGKKDTKKDFARKFFIAQVMLPLTFQFVSDLTKAPFRDDDEDKFSGENYLRAMLLGPLNGLFIAGDALEMIFSGVADTRIWAKKVPVLDGAQELAQGIGKLDALGLLKSVVTDEEWDGDITGAADKIIRGMGRITPGAATGYDIIRDEIKRLEGITEVLD